LHLQRQSSSPYKSRREYSSVLPLMLGDSFAPTSDRERQISLPNGPPARREGEARGIFLIIAGDDDDRGDDCAQLRYVTLANRLLRHLMPRASYIEHAVRTRSGFSIFDNRAISNLGNCGNARMQSKRLD